MSTDIFKNLNFQYIRKADYKSMPGPRPGYKVPDQSHPFYEVVFYDQGCSGTTVIDGVEYRFKEGDVAFIHKNTVHSEEHFSNGVLYFFCFDFTLEPPIKLPKNGLFPNIWDLKMHLNVMHKESINQHMGYKKILALKVYEIILTIQRKRNTDTNHTKNLNFVKNYMDSNYMQNITVESLAKMTGYSLSQFRNLFTKTFGMSPKKYIVDIRCENAAKLLKSTSISCTEIAYRCGFSTSNQMSVLFRKKYKKNPLDFRKT